MDAKVAFSSFGLGKRGKWCMVNSSRVDNLKKRK